LLGVVVFDDEIRISPGVLALQAAGILALVSGVILVARAPALSSLRPVRPLLRHLPGDGATRAQATSSPEAREPEKKPREEV